MDWSKAFLPASFRGVPFHVDGESVEDGRRLAVHDLVGGEAPVVEDLGRQARRWRVTAYVAGSLATLRGHALLAAASAPGAGLLVLPWLGPVRARVSSVAADRAKDRNGYVEFDIEFVPAGGSPAFAPVAGGTLVGGLFAAGIATVAGLAAGRIGSAGKGRALEPPAAVTAAASVEALRMDGGLGAEASDRVARAAEDLAAGAATMLDDPAAYLTSLGETFRDLGREADPDTAARFRLHAAAAVDRSWTGLATAGFLAAAAALVTVRASYAVRQDATGARVALADATAVARVDIGELGPEAMDWLGGLLGEAAVALSREAADRAPLVRVETGVSLPATLLAFKLYGDPARAGELVERNRVATPAFMPVSFEAAAP
jgi:hypothetical protein